MKNEVAARAVAMAELARSGFRPRGDLWFLAVADEEDGFADVGMRWLLEERPDIRPTHSVNEGGGERLPLSDGREVVGLLGRREGHPPGAGHRRRRGRSRVRAHAGATTPYPCSRGCSPRLGDGTARAGRRHPMAIAMLRALLGRDEPDLRRALAEADALHAELGDSIRALMGSTLAPTMLWGSNKRNVMPARATVEVDCRILPGHHAGRRRGRWCGRCSATTSPTSWSGPRRSSTASSSPVDGVVPAAIAAFLAAGRRPGTVLPTLCTGFTDSNYLRAAGGTAAYGFSPFRATPSRCSTPATTTPTSGSTSTTCCCRPASTSTSPGGCSGDACADALPEPAQTDDLRGVLLDYLDFFRGVVADKLDGLAADELAGSVGAIRVDPGRAGAPPGERRAPLAGVGLPRRADRGALARCVRRRWLGHAWRYPVAELRHDARRRRRRAPARSSRRTS